MSAGPRPGTSHRRPFRPAVLVLVLVSGVILASCQADSSRRVEAVGAPTTTVENAPPSSHSPAVGRPVTVEIPTIDVAAEVVAVGLEPSGAMVVPDFGLAGWYDVGPRPGEPGPAVIVAHVDSKAGPDVFFRLGHLGAGDRITVTGDDGGSHVFAVTHQEQVPKDRLPTERIWDDIDEPALRLITCGGSFDHGTGHYRDNVIVYATLAPV